MSKECRDCSNGQCKDQLYEVFFTTKYSIDYGVGNCAIRERYFFTVVPGRIGGLSLKIVEIVPKTPPFIVDIEEWLVLEVNGGYLNLLPGYNLGNESENAVSNGLKPYGVEYLGGCNIKSFEITDIQLLGSNSNSSNKSGIICRCTNGDQQIKCSSAEGGICCISKSILDRLCKKI
jgi:hypothetical protein